MRDKLRNFIEYAGLSDSELKVLGSIFITLIEKYNLFLRGRIDFKTYEEFDVNHISLIIDNRHKSILGKLNLELAMNMASQRFFDNKKFSASIDMMGQDKIMANKDIALPKWVE